MKTESTKPRGPGRSLAVTHRPAAQNLPSLRSFVGASATVELVEQLGNEVIAHTRAGEYLLVAAFEPHTVPKSGDSVELQIETEFLHLFDAATEKRL